MKLGEIHLIFTGITGHFPCITTHGRHTRGYLFYSIEDRFRRVYTDLKTGDGYHPLANFETDFNDLLANSQKPEFAIELRSEADIARKIEEEAAERKRIAAIMAATEDRMREAQEEQEQLRQALAANQNEIARMASGELPDTAAPTAPEQPEAPKPAVKKKKPVIPSNLESDQAQ